MRSRWLIFSFLMFSLLSILVIVIAIRDMMRPDPPGERLRRGNGAGYKFTLTRFSQDEGLVCPPFRINARYDNQPTLNPRILSSEQSDDVTVAQTPSAISVFYNELILDSFDGARFDSRDAKPILCDNNLPMCLKEMNRLTNNGAQMQRVCGRVRR